MTILAAFDGDYLVSTPVFLWISNTWLDFNPPGDVIADDLFDIVLIYTLSLNGLI
jgi:hypothetical protein